MKTDKQLYTLFQANPQWIFELTGLKSPGECEWKSIALKALELTSDGVIFPKDPNEPLTVVEFQFQEDATIYNRTTLEMILLQQENQMREVQGVIFFRHAYLDPKTKPWNQIVRPYLLRDALETLTEQDEAHPLVAAFQPILLTNEETLEKNAALYYNQINTSTLPESVKETLSEVFFSWLLQRFKTMSPEEIKEMLEGALSDLRDTQFAKDFINIGKQEGKEEGKQEGKQEGEQEALIWIMEDKFGPLSPEIRQRIEQITSADKLKALLLQVYKLDSIEQLNW